MNTLDPPTSSEDLAVASALARMHALALSSGEPADAAAYDELSRRLDPELTRTARRLAHAARLVNASLALDAVLHNALALAVNVMNAERGFLMLARDRRIAAQHNFDAKTLALSEDEPLGALVDRVLRTGEAEFMATESSQAPGVSSFACVPLRVRDDVIGVVYLDSRVAPGLFAASDRESLVAFAHQSGLAIENARMFEEEHGRLQSISALQVFQTRILEAIGNGVITLSPRREITTFNRAAESTFGIAAARMTGKDASAIATVIPEFPELLDTFFRSGAVQLRAEVEAMRSDGTELTLEMRLSPLESQDGTGVAMVVTDVTRQRDLEVAHAAELTKAGRVQASFSRYLAPHVVKSLMNDPGSIKLGGERRRATMFFADVRGFTSIAATLPAERVVEILNTYFDEAVNIVFAHDGLLDKFYGDGLMAVFGPPRVRDDDAARAVAAAIALHDVVVRIRTRLDYPLRISVGIATGDVVAGYFGSAQRMDYTVVGDAVNLAHGMQSASPPGGIYCDEETFASAGHISRPVERVACRIKGRHDLVTAYAIQPKPESAP